jgi:hypothetical protein
VKKVTHDLHDPIARSFRAACYWPRRHAHSVSRHVDGLERRAKAIRELHGVIVSPEVNEKRARLFADHVVMDGGHLDPIVAQRRDERIEFARYRRLAPPVGWKLIAIAVPIAPGTGREREGTSPF